MGGVKGLGLGSVLTRPCDGFEKISATFPTYTMLDNSPDGHAVVMMKVCSVFVLFVLEVCTKFLRMAGSIRPLPDFVVQEGGGFKKAGVGQRADSSL
jgi:hypothetical protein